MVDTRAWPVLGELLAVAASLALFLVASTSANALGWVLAALGTSAFYAAKSYYDLSAGVRRVRVGWIELGAKLLLCGGLGVAFLHAFALATEWAK